MDMNESRGFAIQLLVLIYYSWKRWIREGKGRGMEENECNAGCKCLRRLDAAAA